MLTGDISPSRGQCYVVGYDCIKQFEMARKQIGYCPQFDAIFNKLTVREHLEFYAKIKKIPKYLHESLIAKQLKSMNLEQYERKYAGTLSGGNKRKLSVAIAMIGNPPVVFLDEPSAGMDPKARRFMWEVIAKISTRGKNSAVILTTHSMEEAEALSTNMGIMVDGQFKCFGSKQHIKNKFGKGYQVEIKFKSMTSEECEAKAEQLGIKEYLRSKYAISYKVNSSKGVEFLVAKKDACIGILEDVLKNKQALSEFHDKGFGKEIIDSLQHREYYSVNDLIRWENIMQNNFELLNDLVNEFGEAMLLEQYAPRYRYRVPKGEKSVGYFFTFMESLKERLEMDEYSASQTTLEQIFNGFARLEGNNTKHRIFKMNPDEEDNDIRDGLTSHAPVTNAPSTKIPAIPLQTEKNLSDVDLLNKGK